MALRTLIFGTDDIYPKLKPYYDREVERGNLEIVATINALEGRYENIDIVIISSHGDFYRRMKIFEEFGFPRNRIIDGRVFRIPELDFQRLLAEGVAHGVFLKRESFGATPRVIYPQVYKFKNSHSIITLGAKSFIGSNSLTRGLAHISIGKFSSLSWGISFFLGLNSSHNYHNVSSTDVDNFDWEVPTDFFPAKKRCRVSIGSDVWIGRGCTINSPNPTKPLSIGDGAVIASDSVVVKNVPPYAIVGGNPAKIIKFRFSEDVIESLLRIKWWNWSLDKIHDNFKYFNDVERFISMHDKAT